jgi:hypothetical protein
MAKNLHNGTNIIAKHNTFFQGEEILENFMVPTVKTQHNVLAQKIPALYPGAKAVCDREIVETYLNSVSKTTSETDIFPHGTKSLLTSVTVPLNRRKSSNIWENLNKTKFYSGIN